MEKELRWGCGDCIPNDPPWTEDDVAEVLVSWGDDGRDYADTDGFSVVKLKDGRFGVSAEWSDSSGHG